MASIKFGSIITEAAGKVGGQILQRGRSGAQMRNLTKPTEKRNIQTSSRQLPFAITSQLWRTLTNAQITQWNVLASSQTRYNRFGDPYTPSGFQLFTELNLNLRLLSAVSSVRTAPSLLSLPDATAFDFIASTGPNDLELSWTFTSGAPSWYVVPYITSCRQPGSEDRYRTSILIPLTASVTTGTIDLTPVIPSLLPGSFASGNIINGGFRIINNLTGQGTPLYRISQNII